MKERVIQVALVIAILVVNVAVQFKLHEIESHRELMEAHFEGRVIHKDGIAYIFTGDVNGKEGKN